MKKVRIGVVGNIGVGKSTLVRACMSPPFSPILLSALPQREYEESNENNVTVHGFLETFNTEKLDQFYKDPLKVAFALQCEFLQKRVERESLIRNSNGIIIEDRTLEEDYHIFGKAQHIQMNMTTEEFCQYEAKYVQAQEKLPKQDILVYLRARTTTLQKRIQERGRESEKKISTAYLSLLNLLYEEYIKNHVQSPVIIVNAEDYTDKDRFLKETIQKIAEKVRLITTEQK
ncbi:hypothetical protein COV17_01815 [Candidatus Woesearchaeota archaeon CG10_big_fil_rev_8_21_14_0_10_36_11]|nr:MAG: hypothetical protein COV17_01815 [Candidatus Woesearchaeota archaeon CG10_big_fil_rev_8_21_14_0_10_36_11]